MKRTSTVFLQVVIALIGVCVFGLMIWEPLLEGVNTHATLWQVYFTDPFLAYAYVGSIAFFVALYQAFKLMGYVGRGNVFSPQAVKALRIIKYAALSLIGFIIGGEIFLFLTRSASDDPAGGVMMGLFMSFIAGIIATAAAVFESTLQSAIDKKSENDLTV